MFRILEFTIHKHPLLGGKTFELTNPAEQETSNYYSLIIGPNGTGKSFLLSNLIEVFNELVLVKDLHLEKPRKKFTIKYIFNDDTFEITNELRELVCKKNDKTIVISKVNLPTKWLASSVTINDKYPILSTRRKDQISQYEYLGIRSASNNAFIGRITSKTILYFIEALKKKKSESLLSIYRSLYLNPTVELTFVGGPMLKLEKRERRYSIYNSASGIIEPHNKFLKKNKSITNYRANTYRRWVEDSSMIDRIFEFLVSNKGIFERPTKGSMQLYYEVDLKTNHGVDKLLREWNVLSAMLDLELIKFRKLLISKTSPFAFEEASSGEAHLLTSLHGIVAKLEDNSLLVIDEPEISLHPNWQIDYFEVLKSVVDNYKGVNVVISSHSHLLVSSLKNEESRITALKRDKKSGEIIVDELDYETYGWEPERILYKIFGLATQRNNYFESDVRSLLKLLSSPAPEIGEVKRLRDTLAKYILADQDDPLKVIITRADTFLTKGNA